jgi:hypothetical protein
MADMALTRREIEALLAHVDLSGGEGPEADRGPTFIESPSQLSDGERKRILEDYRHRGYAWFVLDIAPEDAAQALIDLSAALELGPSFVPPLYNSPGTQGFYDALGVNLLTAAASAHQPSHPTFESRAALELHSDGTLQAMGEIPSAILFCVTPAERGGETTIFHGANAFLHLARERPDLTCALLDDRALTRHATVNGSHAICAGPVFELRDAEVLSRYSTTPRDRWAFGEVDLLQEAFEALAEFVRPPHLIQIRLEAGQGVVLANDKVAHGRSSFEDSFARTRLMLRALFLRRPR